MKKLLHKIKLLKFEIKIPKKTDVLLLDDDYAKLNLDSEINTKIKNKNSINLYILFLAFLDILLMKSKNLNDSYFVKFIETLNPQIAISHEINPAIFRIKKLFPYIKTIVYQLADQSESFRETSPLMLSINKKYELRADYFLSKNEYSKNFYKFISANHIIAGSVKNNEIMLEEQKKDFDILFISQFRKKIESYYGTNKNIGSMRLIDSCTSYILKVLNELSEEKGFKTAIGLVSNRDDKKYKIDDSVKESELSFFKRDLKKFYYEDVSSYQLANRSKIIVTINSTIGYDLLSRGMKVIFFDLFNFLGGSPLDGHIWGEKNDELFWYTGNEKKTIKEKIMNLIQMDANNWKEKIKKNKNFLFDPGNKILKNIVKEILLKK